MRWKAKWFKRVGEKVRDGNCGSQDREQAARKREHVEVETDHSDIPILLELPLNKGAQLWELFPRKQRRSSRQPKLQVRTTRLAHSRVGRLIVQHVVYQLQNSESAGCSMPL